MGFQHIAWDSIRLSLPLLRALLRAIVLDPLEPPLPSLPGKLEGRLPTSDERVEWYHDPGTGQFTVGFAVGIGHFLIARQMSLQCLPSRFREVDPFRQARLQAANMCFGGADPFLRRAHPSSVN